MELSKIRQSLHRMNRLNRTLLLLSKIDNNQFPERKDIDLVKIIEGELDVYTDIYAGSGIACHKNLPASFIINMNESLATTMVTNLVKNAFLHTQEGGTVVVAIENECMTVSNDGSEPLDATRLFDRFYTSGKSGSTGLGLALVKSIADSYSFVVEYSFKRGKHCFTVKF